MRSSSRPPGSMSAGRGREQHLRLEHEAVADDPHVRPVAEQLAQPAEELRAEAAELLDLAGERHVELAAEVGDRDLLLLDLLLLEIERLLERGELDAQRVDLAIEDVDLVQRLARERLLGRERLLDAAGVAQQRPRSGRRARSTSRCASVVRSCSLASLASSSLARSRTWLSSSSSCSRACLQLLGRGRALAAFLADRLQQRRELGDPALALGRLVLRALQLLPSARRRAARAAHCRRAPSSAARAGAPPRSLSSPRSPRVLSSSAVSAATCWSAAVCARARSAAARSAA